MWYEYVDKHLTGNSRGAHSMTKETRLNATIIVLVRGNPKQSGTACYERFKLYKKCRAVGAYIEETKKLTGENRKNYGSDDLKWDSEHGFIEFEI